MISILLMQEIGRTVENPRAPVGSMVVSRRVEKQLQERESGTVQSDTELMQDLDEWIEFLDEVEREGNERKAEEAGEIDQDAVRSEFHRNNFLSLHANKRYFSDESGMKQGSTKPLELINPKSKRENLRDRVLCQRRNAWSCNTNY